MNWQASLATPHLQSMQRTRHVMLAVCLATVPGLLALTAFYGIGTLVQVTLCILACLLGETLALRLRGRPALPALGDGSILLTGLLLGLALPPLAPWWIAITGGIFASLVVKQLYGGLGQNPFNPAMAAYALLLVSFPLQMSTRWVLPDAEVALAESLQVIFSGLAADAVTGATVLDLFRQDPASMAFEGLLVWPGTVGWINLAFLIGGLALLWRGYITWHLPVAFLTSLGVFALFGSMFSDKVGDPLFQWFSGATMMAAFFILTDPVSCATSRSGKLWFGAGAGLLTGCIRSFGAYPDAVAFAVLLMNFAAPMIDYYTQNRTYGYRRPTRGIHPDDEA